MFIIKEITRETLTKSITFGMKNTKNKLNRKLKTVKV